MIIFTRLEVSANHGHSFSGRRTRAAVRWIAAAAGLSLAGGLPAADFADWRVNLNRGEAVRTVLLQSVQEDGRGTPVKPVAVVLPDGFQFCRYRLNYLRWIGRGEVTVVSAAPGRLVFGISVFGTQAPPDQGWGEIAVTVTGVPAGRSLDGCMALPVIGSDIPVMLSAWAYDEDGRSDLQGFNPYPDAAFGDDPIRPERINVRWRGGYHWEGERLCLEIHDLAAPDPPAHNVSIGYTVTLGGARFVGAEPGIRVKLHSYSGIPGITEIIQCLPVQR